MKTLRPPRRDRGIALLMVMITVVALGILAAGFAYSMKVEVKLARNSSYEIELEWLGRSGVELARYVLGQQMMIAAEPWDSLNQIWAGGPGSMAVSNSPLADINLKNVELGNGQLSVTITDLERKFNINMANEMVLQQALLLIGVDAGEQQPVINSILDWIDRDDSTRVSGNETDAYRGLEPPYDAKNGPVDDLGELLLVQGVTPEIFFGPACTNHSPAAFQVGGVGINLRKAPPVYAAGLVDIFTPISSGRVNINTANTTVLQMIPGVDPNIASEILRLRAGPDGAEGTEDDTPLRNPGELVNVGLPNQAVQQMMRFCDVRSRTFEVVVDASIGSYKRQFVAILGRNNARDIQILSFDWR